MLTSITCVISFGTYYKCPMLFNDKITALKTSVTNDKPIGDGLLAGGIMVDTTGAVMPIGMEVEGAGMLVISVNSFNIYIFTHKLCLQADTFQMLFNNKITALTRAITSVKPIGDGLIAGGEMVDTIGAVVLIDLEVEGVEISVTMVTGEEVGEGRVGMEDVGAFIVVEETLVAVVVSVGVRALVVVVLEV